MENTILKTNADSSTILLIDDHPLLRYGIKQLLSTNPFLTVVAEAGNGRDGLRLADKYMPDLILLNLNMPVLNGLDTLKRLRARKTNSKIIILSHSDKEADIIESMQAGVDGYLLKSIEPADLLHAIQLIRLGVRVISPRVSYVYKQSQAFRKTKVPDHMGLQVLSHREMDVAKLIANGKSNKMISQKLFIAEGTVKIHVRNIFRKLGVHSRVEVALWVYDEIPHCV